MIDNDTHSLSRRAFLSTTGALVVTPDWASIAADQQQILDEYQQVFGG